ncbi:dimethyl sulfoxide reductase anchor subunit family protein [Arcanobacterium phocae]|uniref:dimethyl sulfoxide reductase anchor subunit family protein n=1 Tax=Arcanobacterium phocae TaxID=131112 RepID=UPI001C0F2849|nr:DmsC/YnfH family molybdoenzyme membrane anchor subunit [Arcanobacterium phocae]
MNIHELPMIIFTVVAQMSVGAFWALGAIQLVGRYRKISVLAIDRITDAAMYAVGPLLVAGFFAAFFHLNDPFHAIFTMNHLGSSWLSRELLAGVLFGAFGAAFAVSQWFGWFSRGVREIIAVLTALSGLFLIIAMSGVYYSARTIPAWNNFTVPVFFFASTLLTGPLAVALALLVVWARDPLAKIRKKQSVSFGSDLISLLRSSLQGMTAVATAAGVVIFITYPMYLLILAHGGEVTQHVATGISTSFLMWRLLFLGGAVVIAGVFAFNQAKLATTPNKILIAVIVIAFILAVVSEFMGRSIHYDGLWRAGLNTWQTFSG